MSVPFDALFKLLLLKIDAILINKMNIIYLILNIISANFDKLNNKNNIKVLYS